MTEFELLEIEAALLSARISVLETSSNELPERTRSFGDAFDSVAEFRAYLFARLDRILRVLRREVAEATRSTSAMGRATLQRVAVGKARYGMATLAGDERLIDALNAGSQVPSSRFSTSCVALRQALFELQLEAPLRGEHRWARPPQGSPSDIGAAK